MAGGRPAGTPNHRTLEFIKHYDDLLIRNKDPVEVLFKLLNSRKQSIKVQSASILIGYRFPKLVAQKIEVEGASQIAMSWDTPDETEPPPVLSLEDLEPVSEQ